MCEIDWAALGTWAAVVVALAFAFWDRVDRRLRDRAESRVLTALLETDLLTCVARAKALAEETDLESSGGIQDVLMEDDENIRRDIAAAARDFPTATLESIADRLHVLPATVAVALLDMLSAIREVQLASDVLAGMSDRDAERMLETFMQQFREHIEDLATKAEAAREAAAKVATGVH